MQTAKISKLALAKREACKRQKFLRVMILSLKDKQSESCPRMGVDEHWRLVYRPSWVEQQEIGFLAMVILHECCHLWLKHHARADKLGLIGGSLNWKVANYAMDVCIYEILLDCGEDPGDQHLSPDNMDLPPGKAWEHYYTILMQRAKEEEEKQDNDQSEDGETNEDQQEGDQQEGESPQEESDQEPGDDGEGEPDPNESNSESSNGEGDQEGQGASSPEDGAESGGEPTFDKEQQFGGSCSDGCEREWETFDEGEGDEDVLSESKRERIVRQVSESLIKECGGGQGNAALKYAKDMIEPKIDPRREFMAFVRQAIKQIRGYRDPSFRRLSRRGDPTGTGFLRPSWWESIPNLTILIDTSGSMGTKDIALALGLIRKVITSYGTEGVHIVAGDVTMGMEEYCRDPQRIELRGGGGTDMGKCILDCIEESENNPDLIVCVTDGYTPWCDDPGLPVVIAMTGEISSRYQPPAWAKCVELK